MAGLDMKLAIHFVLIFTAFILCLLKGVGVQSKVDFIGLGLASFFLALLIS